LEECELFNDPTVLKVLSYIVGPVASFALRHGVKLQDFIKVLKQCYVWEAQRYLLGEGETISKSKISAMTGVHRKEVQDFIESRRLDESNNGPLPRVIGQWLTDNRFSRNGQPQNLNCKGADSEFSQLVASVCQDLNPYTVLFELQRLGLVKEENNILELASREYVPLKTMEEGMRLLRSDINDMLHCVEENILGGQQINNLHLTTTFDNIDEEKALEIRQWFLDKGAQLHKEALAFLSTYDFDIQPLREPSEKRNRAIRAVLGTFSRVQTLEPKDHEKHSDNDT
jgi:hypothetical protein